MKTEFHDEKIASLVLKIRYCDQDGCPAYFYLDGKKVSIKLGFEDEES